MRRITLGRALLVLFVACQLVPVDRSNPPATPGPAAPAAVLAVLERSCYDCHSHETEWPWYGYVAPVSWLMAYDVAEAREHLNFSTWTGYDGAERLELYEEIFEMVDEREMPLWYYLLLHSDAELDARDREALLSWAGEKLEGGRAR